MRNIFSDSFNSSIAAKAFRDVLEFGCPHGVFLREKNMHSIAIKDDEAITAIPIMAESGKTKMKSVTEVGRITQHGVRLEWKWNLDFNSHEPPNPFEVTAHGYYKTPRAVNNLLLEEQIYLELLLKIGFLLGHGHNGFKEAHTKGAFYINEEFQLPKPIDIHLFKIGVNAMDCLSTAINIAKSCLDKVLVAKTSDERDEAPLLPHEIKELDQAVHLLDLHKEDLLELSELHATFHNGEDIR